MPSLEADLAKKVQEQLAARLAGQMPHGGETLAILSQADHWQAIVEDQAAKMWEEIAHAALEHHGGS